MNLRIPHTPTLQSAVLHEHGWRRYEAHSPAGALSIKCMFGGSAHYETRFGRHRVDDSRYLLLNHGTPYLITIDQPRPMESFCIFFGRGFVEETLRGLVTPEDRLLEDPVGTNGGDADFFEHTYPHDAVLTPLLMRLRAASARGRVEADWWDEQLRALAARLLILHRGAHLVSARIPAVRPATRAELYRRLHRARDYMEAGLAEPLPVARVARIAAMAPHHFLRAFKHLFGATPHQYLTARRLERARQLLADTDMPITQICFEVGFSSLGSFSWLFHRFTGVSPGVYRKEQRAT